MRVVAHAVRSGIAALNVVTAALDSDERTRSVEVVFARGRDAVARAIARDTPTVVAWSFYSPDARRAAGDLAWLRAHAPAALHVAGGVHATAEPAATVRDGFDVVIAGEGEAAFVELVAAVRAGRDPRGGPGTHWTGGVGPAAPRRPLDDFPACNLTHGRWNPLEITRGCIYACSFCQTPFMFKARFRHRSVDNVRAHVRAMVVGGLRYVRYVSPTSLSYGSPDATVNLAAVEDLLAAVRAELPAGGKQYFGTFPSEVRPEHVSAEALALVKRYADNRSLVIGGQTGSPRLLAATAATTSRPSSARSRSRSRPGCGPTSTSCWGCPTRPPTIARSRSRSPIGSPRSAHASMRTRSCRCRGRRSRVRGPPRSRATLPRRSRGWNRAAPRTASGGSRRRSRPSWCSCGAPALRAAGPRDRRLRRSCSPACAALTPDRT